jgi:hypothetical protein
MFASPFEEAQHCEQETRTEGADADAAPEMERRAGEQEGHEESAEDSTGDADEDVPKAAEAATSHDPAGK